MTNRKITEIAFFTDQVAELTDFYRKLTGDEPVYAAEQIAIFRLGELTLLIHQRMEAAEGEPPNTDHVALGVVNLEQETRELENQGLGFILPPRRYEWGNSAYLLDPDGRLIELHEGEE